MERVVVAMVVVLLMMVVMSGVAMQQIKEAPMRPGAVHDNIHGIMGGHETKAEVAPFGRADVNGQEQEVVLVILQRGPMRLRVTNWGAAITSLTLPDSKGNTSDIVLGYDTFEDYKNGKSYFGALVGRVANRIAGGTFVLNNVRYNLTKNEGNNTLHGGIIGFNSVVWNAFTTIKNNGDPIAIFTYHSFDGEQGFPGNINITVTYKITKHMELVVDMKAMVGEKATPISLAQHTYWNLGGHNSGTILDNNIIIAGDHVTLVDKNLIPTGVLKYVGGTPYDFRKEKNIGDNINKIEGGYDINYVLKNGKTINFEKTSLQFAAKVWDPKSGRAMELYTNEVGLQFYTGNQLSNVRGKDNIIYSSHDGLCLETQGFPNAVNQPNFPSIIVHPGDTYHHKMLYRFLI